MNFSPEIIGVIMIGVMLFAIFIGFPISFTLIFLATVFGAWGLGGNWDLVYYLETLQFSAAMMEQHTHGAGRLDGATVFSCATDVVTR